MDNIATKPPTETSLTQSIWRYGYFEVMIIIAIQSTLHHKAHPLFDNGAFRFGWAPTPEMVADVRTKSLVLAGEGYD